MWANHEEALASYYNVFWDVCVEKWKIKVSKLQRISPESPYLDLPVWFGYEPFHASHRSNLLRKNSEYYGQFGWEEKDDLPYLWPIDKAGNLDYNIVEWMK